MPGNVYMNAMRLPTTLVLAALVLVVPRAWGDDLKHVDDYAEWRQWKVNQSTLAEAGLNTRAYSDPDVVDSPALALACNLWEPGNKWGESTEEHNLHLFFKFKNLRYSGAVRREKDRVQLQLGFWSAVEGEDGDYRLRQELVDYDISKRTWAYKPFRLAGEVMRFPERPGLARLFHHEAADIARRIYRSESFSWINRRNGETHSVEVGEKGRSAIKQVLEVCGFSVHEPSATPTDAADLSSRRP